MMDFTTFNDYLLLVIYENECGLEFWPCLKLAVSEKDETS